MNKTNDLACKKCRWLVHRNTVDTGIHQH